ncbi:MAG: hypothetical protein Q8K60_07120, partial [Parachlamydiaceae bacterium]|nr:hypothetical protein [Parachlamydiaceae bacterium]
MINCDSIPLSMPISVLEGFRKFDFSESTETIQSTAVRRDSWHMESSKLKCIPGLNSIWINQGTNVYIEVSAKSLKAKYHEGININNVEQMFKNINSTGLVTINIKDALDTAKITSYLHVWALIPVNEKIEEYLRDFSLAVNHGFLSRIFKYNGVKIISKVDRINQSMIFYNKFLELLLNPSDIILDNYELEFFLNQLRVELQLMNKESIQKAFGIRSKDILLVDILNSKVNVLLEAFNERYDFIKLPKVSNVALDPKISMQETLKTLGMRALINDNHGDLHLVGKIMKSKSKGNISALKNFAKNQNKEILSSKLNYDFQR